MRRACLVPLAVVACCALASPATAAFHLMRIVQVYGGDVSHPDAQYVVLQMCVANQNFVGGHGVGFFDADGNSLGTADFPAMVANGASQAKILIATSSAETVFGLGADLRAPAAVLSAGGKVCFEPGVSPIDCVAWGGYAALPDPTVGNPWEPTVGLTPGVAAQRDLAIAGDPTMLDCTVDVDDTDDSAADFDPVAPTPGNNAGDDGLPHPDHVFVHAFEAGTADGWSLVQP